MTSRNSLLISAVYRRRCLWDHNNKDHHNHFVLNRIWNEIAEELKTTRNEVRKKWKNLRDRFRLELRKYPRPTCSEDEVKTEHATDEFEIEESSWPHFEALMFLKDQFRTRENKDDMTMFEPRAESSNSVPEPSTLTPEQALFERSIQTSPQASTDTEMPDKINKTRYSLGKRSYDAGNPSNNEMLFFESLLPHIAKLSDQQKMLMMMEIQQCVYKFVYGNAPSLLYGAFPGLTESSDLKVQRTSE